MKKFILFDHDGVLVDTEQWYFKAGERALADIGFKLHKLQYLKDMNQSGGTWFQARAAGIPEEIIKQQITVRDGYYQEYLRTMPIEIEGVEDALELLKQHVKMGIVTTAKRADFDLIHEHRNITQFMEFVIVREDYDNPKPHPAPYLMGLERFQAKGEETLVVEDTYRGLSAAVAAGIECAIVENKFTKSHDFSNATYKIGRLSELVKIIQ
jgi:HAD superfamily hydrolase (TIGR01509 family)